MLVSDCHIDGTEKHLGHWQSLPVGEEVDDRMSKDGAGRSRREGGKQAGRSPPGLPGCH